MNIERLRIYDKCLRSNKHYSAKELMETINNNSNENILSRNTINLDLNYIKSRLAGKTKLIKERLGYTTVYFYKDKNFSLFKTPLNEDEIEKLKLAVAFLSEFKGLPQTRWVTETIDSLTEKKTISSTDIKEIKNIISFDFEKAERIGDESTKKVYELYNLIKNEGVIEINYKPYFKNTIKLIFHPQHIRLYNKRWFLFGFEENSKNQTYIVALDRIVGKLKALKNKQYKRSEIDNWEEHFEDFVGVSKLSNEEKEIKFKAYGKTWYYIKTKPIHNSQRSIKRKDGNITPKDENDYGIFSLSIIPNHELISIFRSFGNKIEIIYPENIGSNFEKII